MNSTPDPSDRRHDPRIDKVNLIQISRFDEEGFRADLATGRTLNISPGGVRLELHHHLPLRSVVQISLVLGEEILEVTGTVVYLEALDGERCGMGIEFNDLDEASRQTLEDFVARSKNR